ncbi:MAG: ABC-2 family transporter protein [Pleomorphochaeta sp.]
MCIFTFIPFAFINYYPTIILLNKNLKGTEFSFLGYLKPGIVLLLFSISIVCWNHCISNYQSTGN